MGTIYHIHFFVSIYVKDVVVKLHVSIWVFIELFDLDVSEIIS